MTELQKETLRVYGAFKSICDKHNLRYYAAGGTKIGAVLWSGFIPWDDDIDLVMPQPDLVTFLDVAKKELSKDFAVFDAITSPHGDIIGIKVYSNSTMFTSNNLIGYPNSFTGVFIDIFPLIGAPSGAVSRARFIDGITKIKDEMYLKKLFAIGDTPTKELIKAYKAQAAKYTFDDSEYIFNPANSHKEEYRREEFIHAKKMKFESADIPVSDNFDAQLKQQYGSYSKEWPEELKGSGHKSFALVNLYKSHTDYARDIQESSIHDYITHLIGYKIDLEQNVIKFGADIEDLKKRLAAELSRNNDLHDELRTRDVQIQDLVARHSQLLESTSWRVTRPLRKAKDIIWRKK